MKRIGIIGTGRFGRALIETLTNKGIEIIAMDCDSALIDNVADVVDKAVIGDATNARALKEAGIDQCDTVVVCIGSNMEGSIMATVCCKDLGIKTVVAKAVSDLHGKVLTRVGADVVVYPERDRAQRLAHSLLAQMPIDIFEIADGLAVSEITPPEELVGKTLRTSNFRAKRGVTVLAIRRVNNDSRLPRTTIIATGDEIIQSDDRLVIFGRYAI